MSEKQITCCKRARRFIEWIDGKWMMTVLDVTRGGRYLVDVEITEKCIWCGKELEA